ncbi:ImmA/IrrE family metallo-endopeptidase [Anaerophilus nitritogenes]|uniref:ImmA/IrrE family metallo-endopeptidase n=1 Tax=Anaerophilus nitritogenes TaxID=2498136 RepID=UPI00101D92C0|nr:ImmA/IrrE family metallo-endopeptidase [Anaerophilus nitritogenes]
MVYNQLLDECYKCNVDVYEMDLINHGLYSDGIIAISNKLQTTVERTCILAEELGHHHTSFGNILDQTKVSNIKQEKRARNWAYERLIQMKDFISAYKYGCSNKFELAEYLTITEEFLDEAIEYFKEKYGLFYRIYNYTIYFEPFGVFEKFQEKKHIP